MDYPHKQESDWLIVNDKGEKFGRPAWHAAYEAAYSDKELIRLKDRLHELIMNNPRFFLLPGCQFVPQNSILDHAIRETQKQIDHRFKEVVDYYLKECSTPPVPDNCD